MNICAMQRSVLESNEKFFTGPAKYRQQPCIGHVHFPESQDWSKN
jgi:hypothetical protein